MAVVVPATPVAELSEKSASHQGFRAFFEELPRLGYVEGRNLTIDRFSGEGRAEYYSELARDVVRRNPDVILAEGSQMLVAFKAATNTIPIVGIAVDPVGSGVVPSLARPGGNITGISPNFDISIWSKRVELLREVTPKASRVALLASRHAWERHPMGAAVREAAEQKGMSLIGPPLNAPYNEAEYRRVLALMMQDSAEALIVGDLPETLRNRRLIVEIVEKGRLPAIYPWHEFVEVGGLMAYGIDLADLGRHAAHQIDLILKGMKPGDIPFYQPKTIKLTINLKTAKALGLTIPPELLALADEVVE
jgi:putative tryptophan/tyrosine transport system substrate-binding protein